jgi:hypothetical protein
MTDKNYRPMYNTPHNGYAQQDSQAAYAVKTFGWMALGLLVTFAVAFGFVATGLWYQMLVYMPAAPFVLAIAELIVVMMLSARLLALSIGAARGMFFLYAVLNGLTLSSLLVYYGVGTAIYAFGITALYFGVLAAYGYFTKRDLTALRPILTIGLIFLLVFWVISMFLPLSGADRLVCFVGLAIFMGCTAYDTQKIKGYYQRFGHDYELAAKGSILCALQLYLDFINLFLYILRLVGRRNNN